MSKGEFSDESGLFDSFPEIDFNRLRASKEKGPDNFFSRGDETDFVTLPQLLPRKKQEPLDLDTIPFLVNFK